jgi:mannosyltransferase OCH1-like enzyme
MEASPSVPSLPPYCDLQDYVQSFQEDDAGEMPVIAKKPSSRRCRACWLDIANEATFLHQALTEYMYALRILQEPPASSPNFASIPKVLHHIWLGSPFPERFQAFRTTWLDHHPTEDGKWWPMYLISDFPLTFN